MPIEQTFIRYDLVIPKNTHALNLKQGDVYPHKELPSGLILADMGKPTFGDLQQLIADVGGPYGWDRRPEYHNIVEMKLVIDALDQDISRRYEFIAEGKTVGGAILANVEPPDRLQRIFTHAGEVATIGITKTMSGNTPEIYKIGLKPEYTNHGLGREFFPALLTRIFQGTPDKDGHIQKPDAVYLNTRDSNHSGVIPFYTSFNMRVIHAITRQDDLLSDNEIQKAKEARLHQSTFDL